MNRTTYYPFLVLQTPFACKSRERFLHLSGLFQSAIIKSPKLQVTFLPIDDKDIFVSGDLKLNLYRKDNPHMNNYNWTTFTKRIAIRATLSDIYNAWTVPKEIERWFLSKAVFDKTTGQRLKSDENVQQNDTYQWSWYLYDVVETGRIIQANGKDLLQFSFAGDCVVEIKLTQNQDDVIVELTQSNIPTDDQSKRGIRLGCDAGWSFFLVNLKSVYEGGIDLRNKNENLKGMLNN